MDPAVPVPGLRAAASAPWGGRGHHDIGGGAEHRVSSSEGVAAPLVRGVLAAVVSLGTALAVVVVPALAAQVAGTQSSATVLDAVLIGLNILVLGHGGGLVLSTGSVDGAVTLTPFGLLGLLMVISAVGMRRVGRALELVRDDGALRTRGVRDAGGALGAYAATYMIGIGVLAAIGRSVDSSPVVTSAVVSGALVAVVGGLAGILWSLRRPTTEDVPGVRVLDLLPRPFDAVVRSATIAVIGLAFLGMLATVVMLLTAVPAQSALFDELSPGIVGGLVLTLIQLALLPLLAAWALVVLLGGSVGVGTGTEISLSGAETGVLPALPMLAALPGPGQFPAWFPVLLVLPAIPVALGAVRLMPEIEELPLRDRLIAWGTYPVAVVVAVLLIAGLSTGGIGDGRLVHLGPRMGTLAGPLVAMALLATALVAAVLATPVIPWSKRQIARLREKVEVAEQAERSQAAAATSAPADEPGPDEPGAGEPGPDEPGSGEPAGESVEERVVADADGAAAVTDGAAGDDDRGADGNPGAEAEPGADEHDQEPVPDDQLDDAGTAEHGDQDEDGAETEVRLSRRPDR